MLKKWQKLSKQDKLKYQFVAIFLIIAIYALIYLLSTSGNYFESKKLLSRKQDRIEKRTKIGDLAGGGLNPKIVAKQIAKIDKEIEALSGTFDELDTGFAPIDSAETQQQLMLEISTLAKRTGVDLLSVARKGFRVDEDITFAPLDKELGRPLLVITANAEYVPLLEFLRGLKDLSFYVSVMNFKVYSRHLKNDRHRRNEDIPAGSLYTSLEVSM